MKPETTQEENLANHLPTGNVASYASLHPLLLKAVGESLTQVYGRHIQALDSMSWVSAKELDDPSSISLAVAYANLIAEDPDAVTAHHLKMLRSKFSVEQIQALTLFIKELVA